MLVVRINRRVVVFCARRQFVKMSMCHTCRVDQKSPKHIHTKLRKIPIYISLHVQTNEPTAGGVYEVTVDQEGYNEKYGADDALDAQSGNGAKTFPKWIGHVGSKNGTAYGVGDVDGYVRQPNVEEPSAKNIPNNVDIVQLVDLVKVQQVEHELMKNEMSNLKTAQEAQTKKLGEVVKAQLSSEKRLRKFVAQEVGKVVANEVGKAVAEAVGKSTQQILDAIRIRPV